MVKNSLNIIDEDERDLYILLAYIQDTRLSLTQAAIQQILHFNYTYQVKDVIDLWVQDGYIHPLSTILCTQKELIYYNITLKGVWLLWKTRQQIQIIGDDRLFKLMLHYDRDDLTFTVLSVYRILEPELYNHPDRDDHKPDRHSYYTDLIREWIRLGYFEIHNCMGFDLYKISMRGILDTLFIIKEID